MVTALMLKSDHTPPLHRSFVTAAHPVAVLRRLSEQNKELRAELRSINGQLDDLIQSAAEKHGPMDTTQGELKTASKHQKLTSRIQQLQDGSYRSQLEQTVLQQETRVKELENLIAQKRKYRKPREKMLESVLETGITPEMAAALADQQAQFTLQSKKLAEVEKRNAQIAETFRKLGEREEQLTKEIAEIEATGVKITPESPSKPQLSVSISHEQESVMKKIDNSIARKRVMVNSLEQQLREMQEMLGACSLKLKKLSEDMEKKTTEVQNMSGMVEERGGMHRRAWSNPSRRAGFSDR